MAAEAAPPPPGGGHLTSSSPTFRKKAFSELLAHQSPAEVVKVQASITTHRREPAVVFKANGIVAVATPWIIGSSGKICVPTRLRGG